MLHALQLVPDSLSSATAPKCSLPLPSRPAPPSAATRSQAMWQMWIPSMPCSAALTARPAQRSAIFPARHGQFGRVAAQGGGAMVSSVTPRVYNHLSQCSIQLPSSDTQVHHLQYVHHISFSCFEASSSTASAVTLYSVTLPYVRRLTTHLRCDHPACAWRLQPWLSV